MRDFALKKKKTKQNQKIKNSKNKTEVNTLFYGSIQWLSFEGLLYVVSEVLEPAGK